MAGSNPTESLLREAILRTSPMGIAANDPSGRVILYNDVAERILGYPREEVLSGKVDVREMFPPGMAKEAKACLLSNDYGGRGRLVDFRTEGVDASGRRFVARLDATLLEEEGRETAILGFFHDLTGEEARREEIRESEEHFRGIFESALDAIVSFGDDRRISLLNRSAEGLLGRPADQIRGRHFTDFLPEQYTEHWDQIERYVAFPGAGGMRKYVELAVSRPDGTEVPVQISVAEREIRGKKVVTTIIRDVTERRRLEERLRLLSITDTLTQLFNRRHFITVARKEIERARRTKIPFSLLLLDADHFKNYNDTWGHGEGDKVLQKLAELMRTSFRTMDSSFRFGGEEFLVLMPETDREGALVAAERFRAALAATAFRPDRKGPEVRVTVSMGVASWEENDSVDDLLRFADIALYEAKNEGRDRIICRGIRPPAGGG
jgi:diguanylate cyclase (GGDEF)-like protein/PAS domain S-box-containing protein